MNSEEETRGTNSNVVILEWGNSVKNNRCTNCGKDLTNLFPLIVEGQIPSPKCCPGCGAEFNRPALIHQGFTCGNCQTLIADPQIQTNCTECGIKIDYSKVKPKRPED